MRRDFIPSVSEPFQELAPDTILWRYMDFTKYVSLLVTNTLWCSSLVALEADDPFEGAAGLLKDRDANNAAFEQEMLQHHLDGLKDSDVDTQRKYAITRRNMSGSLDNEEFAKQLAQTEREYQEERRARTRKNTYVNCWYESDFESLAMWKLYSKDNQNAVAIKTTYSNLRRAINQNGIISDWMMPIGRINYIDYANPPRYFNKGAAKEWFKSYHFEHEQEVRVIPYFGQIEDGPVPSGQSLPVDLSILVEEIYVSPWSQPWLHEMVTGISDKYGVHAPVVESEIARKPYY